MFKSQDAVKQLLKLSEVEMMEKLFQMELSKAVSVRPLYNSSIGQLGSFLFRINFAILYC